MLNWLTALIALVQLVPSAVALLEQIVAVVNNHPNGPAAGVQELQNHLSSLAVAPEVKKS